MATYETPGAGVTEPSRYTPIMARVNSSFLRRSGVLKARPKAVSKAPPGVRPGVREGSVSLAGWRVGRPVLARSAPYELVRVGVVVRAAAHRAEGRPVRRSPRRL